MFGSFKTFSSDVFGQAEQSGTLRRLFGAIVGRPFFEESDLENAVKHLLISKGLDENLPLRDYPELMQDPTLI
jgi:hypothetical protein